MPLTVPVNTSRTLEELIPLLSPAVWFRFLDVGGTTVTDSSGNGRNGTAVPGTGTVTLAAGSAAITAGGRITIADNTAFSIPTTGGLTVWGIMSSSAGSYLATKGGQSSNNYEWQITRIANGGQMTAVVHSSSGGTLCNATSTTLTGPTASVPNTFGAAFWDRTADSPTVCSINGKAQRPTPTHTVTSGYADGPSVVTLGSRVDQGTADFAGVFYQFAIFPYQLEPVGLLALAQAAIRSGFAVPLAA